MLAILKARPDSGARRPPRDSHPVDRSAPLKRVLIESPFAAATIEDAARNGRYLRAVLRDSLMRGEAPFASHGLYTLPGVLDDNVPVERELGIEAGLAWGRMAHITAVYSDLGISAGMRLGIDRAHSQGR